MGTRYAVPAFPELLRMAEDIVHRVKQRALAYYASPEQPEVSRRSPEFIEQMIEPALVDAAALVLRSLPRPPTTETETSRTPKTSEFLMDVTWRRQLEVTLVVTLYENLGYPSEPLSALPDADFLAAFCSAWRRATTAGSTALSTLLVVPCVSVDDLIRFAELSCRPGKRAERWYQVIDWLVYSMAPIRAEGWALLPTWVRDFYGRRLLAAIGPYAVRLLRRAGRRLPSGSGQTGLGPSPEEIVRLLQVALTAAESYRHDYRRKDLFFALFPYGSIEHGGESVEDWQQLMSTWEDDPEFVPPDAETVAAIVEHVRPSWYVTQRLQASLGMASRGLLRAGLTQEESLGGDPTPITVDGRVFLPTTLLATRLPVSERQIRRWAEQGKVLFFKHEYIGKTGKKGYSWLFPNEKRPLEDLAIFAASHDVLARNLGVSRRQLRRWLEEGAPKELKAEHQPKEAAIQRVLRVLKNGVRW